MQLKNFRRKFCLYLKFIFLKPNFMHLYCVGAGESKLLHVGGVVGLSKKIVAVQVAKTNRRH